MSKPPAAPGVGHASGKVLLLGEHAVVYGMPAIAAGIALGATARAVRSEASQLCIGERSARTGDGSELAAAFASVLRELGLGPHRVEVEVELPLGSGLGGSAAIGVAVARALLAAAGEPDVPARVLSAAAAWERVFHGTPSGVDAAAAYHGGCIWFTQAEGATPLELGARFELSICLAGPPASTKQMVAGVRRLGERRPELLGKSLAAIESLVKNAKLCLQAGDLAGLGQLMNYNQMLLSGLFLSTPEIERACALGREAGALGAKLTGAGGGGAVIALCEGSGEPVTAAFRAAGFRAFSTRVEQAPSGAP